MSEAQNHNIRNCNINYRKIRYELVVVYRAADYADADSYCE